MALKIKPNPTFWFAVHITDPASAKPAVVDFEFVHKTKEELAAWMKGMQDSSQWSDDAFLAEVVKDWKGVDAEYSPSALRDLLSNYPASGLEIFRGYCAALTESRKKN
jgi:hypothetical protein